MHLRLDVSPLQEQLNSFSKSENSWSKEHLQVLTHQHRCPREIAEFSYRQYYQNYQRHQSQEWHFCKPLHVRKNGAAIMQSLGLDPLNAHPVAFYQVRGQEKRDTGSPSIVNEIEAAKLVKLVKDLASNRRVNLGDIAVLAEQYRHRRYIIDCLRAEKLGQVFVGSSYSMQGREFPFVFISTGVCRPKKEAADADVDHRRIWNDYKKLNTAMTRASELVCIVGDSATLGMDSNWQSFVAYCQSRHSFIGNPPTVQFETLPPVGGLKAPAMSNTTQYPPLGSVGSSPSKKGWKMGKCTLLRSAYSLDPREYPEIGPAPQNTRPAPRNQSAAMGVLVAPPITHTGPKLPWGIRPDTTRPYTNQYEKEFPPL